MRYFFSARIVIEPIRIQRIENETRADAGFSFGHHAYPMRRMCDELQMRSEIETPRGLTDKQQKALEVAMNRMLQDFRVYVAEEFSQIECP